MLPPSSGMKYKVQCNTVEIRMRMWQDYTLGEENLHVQTL
jgi:hypothetical protein